MSADVIARGLAIAAGRKAGIPPFAFADLATQSIPAGVNALLVTVGSHPAVAVSDALATGALAAAHPRFCKVDAGGRHFRLVGDEGAISVELGGALGQAGVNDRPAFQATIDYAHAAGIKRVIMTGRAYELWTSVRTQSPYAAPFSEDGRCLVMRGGLALEGVGAKPILYRKSPAGGDPTPKSHYVLGGTDFYWRGGGIFFAHDGSFDAATRTVLRNFVIDGGCARSNSGTTDDYATYPLTFDDDDGWDLSDKGVWIQDMTIGELVMEDVEVRKFRGELLYGLGAGNSAYLRRVHAHTTNGDADNFFGGYAEYDDCKFGNAFQAAESSGGYGHTYRRCLFYETKAMGFGNGGNAAGQYNYAYPVRDPAQPIPWTTFEDCEFRNCGNVLIASWVRGSVKSVDTGIFIQGLLVTDVDLVIDAVADRNIAAACVFLQGPLTLTDPIDGAPAGTYNLPIQRTRIHVRSALQTKQAAANGLRFTEIFVVRGYVDPNTVILTAGEGIDCQRFWNGYAGSFAECPRIPFIVRPRTVRSTHDTTYGDKFVNLNADTVIDGGFLTYTLYNPSGSNKTLTIDSSLVHARGQRIRMTMFEYNAPSAPVTLPKNGAGLMLPADRALYRGGEWIELEWTPEQGKWLEVGYFSQGAP